MRSGQVRVITAPTAAAIDALLPIAELRAHCRARSTDDDADLTRFAYAAFQWMHAPTGWLGRSVLQQSLALHLSGFQPGYSESITLPCGPINANAITAVKYYDIDNAVQTLAASDYFQDDDALVWARDFVPPEVYDRPGAVRIEYTAGYANAAAVPTPIKQAALMMVGHWFENRDAVAGAGALNMVPLGAEELLAPLKLWV